MDKCSQDFIKSLTPPIVLDFYRSLWNRGRFVGNYLSWEDACQDSGNGYDSDTILENVKESLLKVKKGGGAFERDSVIFNSPSYWWPLLSGLLWVASRNGNRLNLLDFGGSLGSTYYQNKKFICHLDELKWNIVEQGRFVECGKLQFENEHIKFYFDIDECIRHRNPDAILFSGVIQYLEKPFDLLEEILDKGFSQIIFDRTPFLTNGNNDRLTVQKVPHHHNIRYPAWFFNLDKFLDFFSVKYELIAAFDSMENFSSLDVSATSKGFIFEKKAE
ncbi:MAG: methyltransferase, TIGR04325 family [Desulfuromonadaceae bacterium]